MAAGSGIDGIDWAIVGGESGPGARPMAEEWVLDIRDQCLRHGVCFFFKQWGGVTKKKTGRLLEGRSWDELPDRRPGIQLELGDWEGDDGKSRLKA
jgi:protein gp37